MVNDDTESIDLPNCERCRHCTKREISTYTTEDEIIVEEWYSCCNIDGTWIDSEESDHGACPQFEEAYWRI